jgi:2',3'-cyclic-nucleotide 2'-phosphodiesterase (5'-nucleotidase family)
MRAVTERLTILHTNDIHGRIDGLARISTLVAQTRASANHPVLYVDAGDIEDTSVRLSSVTKGVAMHRILSAVGCEAAAVGNGGLIRYGPNVLGRYAADATYPLFLANVVRADGATIPGVRPSGILEAGEVRIGVIGLTDPFDAYTQLFGLRELEVVPLVRELARDLRARGAQVILVLSHLGWQHDGPNRQVLNDQDLAAALQDHIDLVIGAHTHHVLEGGRQIGRVWVAQAGSWASHLGRVELVRDSSGWRVESCTLEPITTDIPADSRVLEAMTVVEAELEGWLGEALCRLEADLNHAPTAECAAGNLMADALRAFWDAEIGLSLGGMGFLGGLGAGVVTRGAVYERVPSSANPGVTNLRGWQILAMLEDGLDPAKAAESPKGYRGAARGVLHVSNMTRRDGQWFVGDKPLEPDAVYRAAASDAELDAFGGLARAQWNLTVQYDLDVVMCEALERYLLTHPVVQPETGRIA